MGKTSGHQSRTNDRRDCAIFTPAKELLLSFVLQRNVHCFLEHSSIQSFSATHFNFLITTHNTTSSYWYFAVTCIFLNTKLELKCDFPALHVVSSMIFESMNTLYLFTVVIRTILCNQHDKKRKTNLPKPICTLSTLTVKIKQLCRRSSRLKPKLVLADPVYFWDENSAWKMKREILLYCMTKEHISIFHYTSGQPLKKQFMNLIIYQLSPLSP